MNQRGFCLLSDAFPPLWTKLWDMRFSVCKLSVSELAHGGCCEAGGTAGSGAAVVPAQALGIVVVHPGWCCWPLGWNNLLSLQRYGCVLDK